MTQDEFSSLCGRIFQFMADAGQIAQRAPAILLVEGDDGVYGLSGENNMAAFFIYTAYMTLHKKVKCVCIFTQQTCRIVSATTGEARESPVYACFNFCANGEVYVSPIVYRIEEGRIKVLKISAKGLHAVADDDGPIALFREIATGAFKDKEWSGAVADIYNSADSTYESLVRFMSDNGLKPFKFVAPLSATRVIAELPHVKAAVN